VSSLVKISEAASLALHTMVMLAGDCERPLSAREMAASLSVSEAHLAKVLQRLGREGLVNSRRGPRGGFSLGRPADDINLLMVYEATEGPLQSKECLLSKRVCRDVCLMGDLLNDVDNRVRSYLTNTRLSDLANTLPCEVCHG
jgi:Rrf2 family nitric oxide-sensitive transcriptional repressor